MARGFAGFTVPRHRELVTPLLVPIRSDRLHAAEHLCWNPR